MQANAIISFYQRFESDILSGKKTITIRNEVESQYGSKTILDAVTFEEGRYFAKLELLSIAPVQFNELNEAHATAENMTLVELKNVISEIYPNEKQLYVLTFRLT